ncbi:hypothetical protein D0Y65_053456, partial [Glycine soja]
PNIEKNHHHRHRQQQQHRNEAYVGHVGGVVARVCHEPPWLQGMCSCAPCHFSPSRATGSRNLTISVTDSLTNATTMFHHRAIMVSPPPSPITSLGWTNCTNSMSSSFVARLLQLEVNRLEEEKTKEKDKKDDEKPDVAVSSELWPKMTKRDSLTRRKRTKRDGKAGDTAYTKIFVGGLAWGTKRDTLKHYFD